MLNNMQSDHVRPDASLSIFNASYKIVITTEVMHDDYIICLLIFHNLIELPFISKFVYFIGRLI